MNEPRGWLLITLGTSNTWTAYKQVTDEQLERLLWHPWPLRKIAAAADRRDARRDDGH
jgi:hypothetical protein